MSNTNNGSQSAESNVLSFAKLAKLRAAPTGSSRQDGDLPDVRHLRGKAANGRDSKAQRVAGLPSKAANGRDSGTKAAPAQGLNGETSAREARVFTPEEIRAIYEQLPLEQQIEITLMFEDIQRRQRRQRRVRVGDEEWDRAFGARLRAARIAVGVTEEEAARVAGRSVETWRNYERTGKGHITVPVVEFAKRYGISLDSLIGDPE